MISDKGAKAPQTSAQRKKKQRDGLRAKGLVMARFPETWVEPEQAKQIEFKTAQVIAQVLGDKNAN